MKRDERGFTLIELLIVIAIIGILSAVVLAALNTARARSRDAERERSIHEIESALQLYWVDNGQYPSQPFPANISVLATFLVPKYISDLTYDMTNLSLGAQYFRPDSQPDSYLIYEPTEKQQAVSPPAFGCRTGVGGLVDGSGLYTTSPRC